jgi:GNAT superfamily N-acetyltransferase
LTFLEYAPRQAAHAGMTPDRERSQSRNNMSNSSLPGSIPLIRRAGPADATWIVNSLRGRWSTTTIVVHGEVIEVAELPALIIAGDRQGLATYRALGRDAELVTLDAMPTGAGIGTALIEALVTRLHGEGRERLWLTTTNDKLSALRFYMRRGFRVIQVRPGAVDAARKAEANNSSDRGARDSRARGDRSLPRPRHQLGRGSHRPAAVEPEPSPAARNTP